MTSKLQFHAIKRRRFSVLPVLAFLSIVIGSAHGQVATGSPTFPPDANAAPVIAAISPNSGSRGGPGFILSVIGSHFLPGSIVQWNTSRLQTIFVSSKLVTASVPASARSDPGDDIVTVKSPIGTSNSLLFTVPCVIPPPSRASTQTRARLGAYYFDGWSGSLTNFHFQGMPLGPYQSRQPFSGWQDSNRCAIEAQLASARS